MFEFTTAVVAFCVISGLFFLALWLYYDRRDHRMFEGERRKTIFHCVRCDHLYAVKTGTAVAPCPNCGKENAKLHF